MNFKDFDKYQQLCLKSSIHSKTKHGYIIPALGVTGEAGEVADKIKKVLRDDNGKISTAKRNEISKEIGDMLWYTSMLCTEIGLKLSDVIKLNLEKIAYRSKENKIHGSGDNR
jgi:NTP pyrophosphatase (non-canonical NTP hydrolase)